MAIKVIAQRRVLKIGKNPGVKKFVIRPDLYIPVQEKKVFSEASTHSGINAGVIKAAMRTLLEQLHRRYPRAMIVGHRDLNPAKDCPGYENVAQEYADLQPG